jgi:hypothetical protein
MSKGVNGFAAELEPAKKGSRDNDLQNWTERILTMDQSVVNV